MNAAPAHLEAKLRFWDFTIGQIAAAVVGVLCGFVWASYREPVRRARRPRSAAPTSPACRWRRRSWPARPSSTSGGCWRAIARWRRLEGRYLPGRRRARATATCSPANPTTRRRAGSELPLDLDALWERRRSRVSVGPETSWR